MTLKHLIDYSCETTFWVAVTVGRERCPLQFQSFPMKSMHWATLDVGSKLRAILQ